MSKTYKDSPRPLNKEADPNPLFPMVEKEYVVKSLTPIERQRQLDGSQHSMMRPSSIEPKGIDLYLSGDKIDKSIPLAVPKRLDASAIIKSFMEKDEDDDEEDTKKSKPKLGSGERFKQLSSKLEKKGVEDPDALAAAIGRKKFGKKKFQKLAAKGK